MKAILIARVSTEEQRDAGNSLPAQIARLERYCLNKGFMVTHVCSFDESAYTNDRTEFDRISTHCPTSPDHTIGTHSYTSRYHTIRTPT